MPLADSRCPRPVYESPQPGHLHRCYDSLHRQPAMLNRHSDSPLNRYGRPEPCRRRRCTHLSFSGSSPIQNSTQPASSSQAFLDHPSTPPATHELPHMAPLCIGPSRRSTRTPPRLVADWNRASSAIPALDSATASSATRERCLLCFDAGGRRPRSCAPSMPAGPLRSVSQGQAAGLPCSCLP